MKQNQEMKPDRSLLSQDASCRKIAETLLCLAQRGDRFGLFGHDRADGDSYACTLSLALVLARLGAEVKAYFSEPIHPPFLDLPGLEFAVVYTGTEADPDDFDISILLDCAAFSRLQLRRDLAKRALIDRVNTLIVDHHEIGQIDGDLFWIDSSSPSCAEMMLSLYLEMEALSQKKLIDEQVANLLYVGILTDTNRFSYPATKADTLRKAAFLLEKGADKEWNERIFDRVTEEHLKALQVLLPKIERCYQGRLALLCLSEAEAQAFSDEEIAFYPSFIRSIEGVCLSVVLRQSAQGVRGNVRAKLGYSARQLAQAFDGGGHELASGFRSQLALKEVYELVKLSAAVQFEEL